MTLIYRLIYQQTAFIDFMLIIGNFLYKSITYNAFRRLKLIFIRNLAVFPLMTKTVHNFHQIILMKVSDYSVLLL
jgi:hypothetical protein